MKPSSYPTPCYKTLASKRTESVQVETKTHPSKALHTPPHLRHCRVTDASLNATEHRMMQPVPSLGARLQMTIFGEDWGTNELVAINEALFSTDSYLPKHDITPLTGTLSILSDLAIDMPLKKAGNEPGLMAQNTFRDTVRKTLVDDTVFDAAMDKIRDFKTEKDPDTRENIAREIAEIAFFSQWIIRGYLFEGMYQTPPEPRAEVRIPSGLAKVASAANMALGRQQIEFVYTDYTLAAGHIPDGGSTRLNVDRAADTLDYIASIGTLVGVVDVEGKDGDKYNAEHNFRMNHVAMEEQMIPFNAAFSQVIAQFGSESPNDGDMKAAWDTMADAARKAHLIFKTMGQGTPTESYPKIRLMISGTRGKTGNVYDERGVFYEGCGEDLFDPADPNSDKGMWVSQEWGQTGANSTMFKKMDTITGTAQLRNAYTWNEEQQALLEPLMRGEIDVNAMYPDNPVAAMQLGFDLYTRPLAHLEEVVGATTKVNNSGILDSTNKTHLLGRLRVLYWVAEHRSSHLSYVRSHILDMPAEGDQPRAVGTGGSTASFLPEFIRQTLGPGRDILAKLEDATLSKTEHAEIDGIQKRFAGIERLCNSIETRMTKIGKADRGEGPEPPVLTVHELTPMADVTLDGGATAEESSILGNILEIIGFDRSLRPAPARRKPDARAREIAK